MSTLVDESSYIYAPLGIRSLLMFRVIAMLLATIETWFRSRLAMQMELIALRHQVAVYKQRVSRPKLQPADRVLWAL
jgi:hypothetical protein